MRMRTFKDFNNLDGFKTMSRIFTAGVSAALKTLGMGDVSIGVVVWDKGSPDTPGLMSIDSAADEVPLAFRALLNAMDAKTYEPIDLIAGDCDCPACRSERKARANFKAKNKAGVDGQPGGGPVAPERIDGAYLNLDGKRQRFNVLEFVDHDGTITPVRPADILAVVRAHNQAVAASNEFTEFTRQDIANLFQRPPVPGEPKPVPNRLSGITPWTDPIFGVWISPWDADDHNPGGWAVAAPGKPLWYSSRESALDAAQVMCDEAPDGDRHSYIVARIDGSDEGMLGFSKLDRRATDAGNVGLAQGQPSGNLRAGAGEGTGGDPGGGAGVVPPAALRPQGQALDNRGRPRWESDPDAGRDGSSTVVSS